MMRVFLGAIRRIKGELKIFTRKIVTLIASFPSSRKILNTIYLKLTPSQRSSFHKEFAKIFRNSNIRGSSGIWKIAFLENNYDAFKFWKFLA